jgi:hypothetical protein
LSGLELTHFLLKVDKQLTQWCANSIGIKYPDNWDDFETPAQNLLLVDIGQGSEEWTKVHNRFIQCGEMGGRQITKLQRVQNKNLWSYYTFTRRKLIRKLRSKYTDVPNWSPNAQYLFHGTNLNPPVNIYNGEIGFNMNYSQRGMWGRGTYFAVNASYSVPYAPLAAEKQMFLAKVLLGDHTELAADSSLVLPPQRDDLNTDNQTDHYDSVQGATNGSVVFVVYANNQAYPEYLITYK